MLKRQSLFQDDRPMSALTPIPKFPLGNPPPPPGLGNSQHSQALPPMTTTRNLPSESSSGTADRSTIRPSTAPINYPADTQGIESLLPPKRELPFAKAAKRSEESTRPATARATARGQGNGRGRGRGAASTSSMVTSSDIYLDMT